MRAKGSTWEKNAETNELVIEQIEHFFRRFGPEGSRKPADLGILERHARTAKAEEFFEIIQNYLRGRGVSKNEGAKK